MARPDPLYPATDVDIDAFFVVCNAFTCNLNIVRKHFNVVLWKETYPICEHMSHCLMFFHIPLRRDIIPRRIHPQCIEPWSTRVSRADRQHATDRVCITDQHMIRTDAHHRTYSQCQRQKVEPEGVCIYQTGDRVPQNVFPPVQKQEYMPTTASSTERRADQESS
jgi:hypothetical protein